MIYDHKGDPWVTPRLIGFHQQVQSTTHEPADSLSLPTQNPKPPDWVSDESHSEPYCKAHRHPRR